MNDDARTHDVLQKLINGKRCTSADGRLLAKAIENLYQHLMLLRAAIEHYGKITDQPLDPDHLVERHVRWLQLQEETKREKVAP